MVNSPPTQVPSAKQTTARVRRPRAAKASRKTSSKRSAITRSSAADRAQNDGVPVEPDDTAIMSPITPSRQSSGRGKRRM
nr:hypothetical protein GCM10020093_035660 [Planobispora longispora]